MEHDEAFKLIGRLATNVYVTLSTNGTDEATYQKDQLFEIISVCLSATAGGLPPARLTPLGAG